MWVSPPFCFWMHANQTESHLSLLLFSLKESAKRDNGNPPGAVAETSRDRGQQTKARLYDTISKTYIRVSMVNHSWQTCMYLQIGEPRQYESMHKESIFRPEYHPNTLLSFETQKTGCKLLMVFSKTHTVSPHRSNNQTAPLQTSIWFHWCFGSTTRYMFCYQIQPPSNDNSIVLPLPSNPGGGEMYVIGPQ